MTWDVRQTMQQIEQLANQVTRRELLTRYGIDTPKAYGVAIGDLQRLGKQIGRNHALALQLWKTGWYEARLVACFIGDPAELTSQQMDAWCETFDNWGIVDTACFHLFDRTPLAWEKVAKWCALENEFGRRAGFALLASLALHDKEMPDAPFEASLNLIRALAHDERNFVKKAVSWAFHAIGIRNARLHAKCLALATNLASSANPGERWVGKDVMKKLQTPATLRRVQA